VEPRAHTIVGRPQGTVSRYVDRYIAYHYDGFPAGVQVGLPSTRPVFVISLDEPVVTARAPDPAQHVGPLQAFVCGPTTSAAELADPGRGSGLAIEMNPVAATALFRVTAVELANNVVDLSALLPKQGRHLTEQLAAATTWPDRFAVIDDVLARCLVDAAGPSPQLTHAWAELTGPDAPPIRDIAADLGWSRRHLTRRFTELVGLTPRQLRRVARIERSAPLLLAGQAHAHVAVAAGFFDQSHMTREWHCLVRKTPSQWLSGDAAAPSVLDVHPPDGVH
jgi:AraC-like DNA-binding protein